MLNRPVDDILMDDGKVVGIKSGKDVSKWHLNRCLMGQYRIIIAVLRTTGPIFPLTVDWNSCLFLSGSFSLWLVLSLQAADLWPKLHAHSCEEGGSGDTGHLPTQPSNQEHARCQLVSHCHPSITGESEVRWVKVELCESSEENAWTL